MTHSLPTYNSFGQGTEQYLSQYNIELGIRSLSEVEN